MADKETITVPKDEVESATKEEAQGVDVEMKEEPKQAAPGTGNAGTNSIMTKVNRKVVLRNVEKFMKKKDIVKQVDKIVALYKNEDKSGETSTNDRLKLTVENIRKPPESGFCYVTFEKDEMANAFIEFVNRTSILNKKGTKTLKAEAVTGSGIREDDGGDDKKRGRRDIDGKDDKRARHSDRGPVKPKYLTDDEIRNLLIPNWKLTREEQLQRKQTEMIKRCCINIIKEIKKIFRTREKEMKRNPTMKKVDIYDWVTKKRSIELDQIISSPLQYEYRNKCEFTFGYRYFPQKMTNEENLVEGQKEEVEQILDKVPAVGYMTSGWSGGVSSPHATFNTPSECCGIADLLDKFLSTSPIPPYNSKLHTGLWRVATIRFSRRTNTCMVIIQHAPAKGGAGARECGSDDYSEYFEAEKDRLIKILTSGPIPLPKREMPHNKESLPSEESKEFKITSIYFQEFAGLSAPTPEHPVQHVFGSKTMQERLGKCVFQVSPGAFFQVNTLGAELLYDEVVRRIKEVEPSDPKKVLLLDVCCGTGTIGLTCIKEGVAGHLLGVDVSIPAIEDAKRNARSNWSDSEASNARFVASRAELVLSKEINDAIKRHNVSNVIAVVDPARDGLHTDVIRALRATKQIQRLIYVSCNPTKSLVRDAGMLCMPSSKKYQGNPFFISGGRPVDMFPMTEHCEMVMVFDRDNDATLADSKLSKGGEMVDKVTKNRQGSTPCEGTATGTADVVPTMNTDTS